MVELDSPAQSLSLAVRQKGPRRMKCFNPRITQMVAGSGLGARLLVTPLSVLSPCTTPHALRKSSQVKAHREPQAIHRQASSAYNGLKNTARHAEYWIHCCPLLVMLASYQSVEKNQNCPKPTARVYNNCIK